MARRHMNTGGFEEMEARLAELGKSAATKAGNKAVRRGAVLAAKEVRADAPRESGFLKRNIRARKGRARSTQAVTYIVSVGKAWYAALLEFGTRKMAAKPFFGPAMERVSKEVFNEMRDELKAAIERIARGGKA